jgi:hypothetical protein
MGVPKFPRLGLPRLWGPITLCSDLWLRWGLKQSYNPHWELSHNMWHTTCMQGNWVESQLLVVGSQIANLTLGLSFGHNLCFKCPNGSWNPILDIYVSIAFQWYKKLFNPLALTPAITLWRFGSPPGFQIPKVAPLGVWRFIPSHFPSLLGFLLAHNLASPCLGHEPKARVATNLVSPLLIWGKVLKFFMMPIMANGVFPILPNPLM